MADPREVLRTAILLGGDLNVAIEDGGDGVGGDDLVEGGIGQIESPSFGRVKVGDKEDHFAWVVLFEQLAAADDGAAGAHHIVHHDEVFALDVGWRFGESSWMSMVSFVRRSSLCSSSSRRCRRTQGVSRIEHKTEGTLVGSDQ